MDSDLTLGITGIFKPNVTHMIGLGLSRSYVMLTMEMENSGFVNGVCCHFILLLNALNNFGRLEHITQGFLSFNLLLICAHRSHAGAAITVSRVAIPQDALFTNQALFSH